MFSDASDFTDSLCELAAGYSFIFNWQIQNRYQWSYVILSKEAFPTILIIKWTNILFNNKLKLDNTTTW